MKSMFRFVAEKRSELEAEYRSVEFVEAIDVKLEKNGVSESFTARATAANQQGNEVLLHELEDGKSVHKENGTKVKFMVKVGARRKPIRKEFYFLWVDGEADGENGQNG